MADGRSAMPDSLWGPAHGYEYFPLPPSPKVSDLRSCSCRMDVAVFGHDPLYCEEHDDG